MEKLKFPERYLRATRRDQTMLISEDTWQGLPYHPDVDCRVCNGAGFVHPGDGEKVIYSEVIPCMAPGCLRDSIRDKQPGEVMRQTFETFMPVPGTDRALKAARALAYGEVKFIWLLLYGPPGNGKTHLGNAIVKVVRDRGINVRMILAADLFSMLREGINTHETDALLRGFKDTPFLVIDDFGVQYGSDWEDATFDDLMTSRFATAKPTVLITNRELTELPERIQSRFKDKVMARAVHNSAPDFRETRGR